MNNDDWLDAYQAEHERLELLAEYRQTVRDVEARIIEADDELWVLVQFCKWRQQFPPGDDDNER